MPKKTVIIIGTFGGDVRKGIRIYNEPVPDGAEIWGCSDAYLCQPDLSRTYTADPLTGFTPKILEEMKRALAERPIPFVCQKHYPEFPTSVPYPLEEIVRAFGINYFTSTISYMLAQAIYEGYEKIIIHRIHTIASFTDYIMQKACADAWCFYALAKGIEVAVSEDSHMCGPYPWQSANYGYLDAPNEMTFIAAFASIGSWLWKLPRLFVAPDADALRIAAKAEALARWPEKRKFTRPRRLGTILAFKQFLAPEDKLPEGTIMGSVADAKGGVIATVSVPETAMPQPQYIVKQGKEADGC